MAYKTLTTQTMVTITGAWLDEGHERPLIQSLPQAGPLLTAIDKAHKGILVSQKLGAKVNEKVLVIQKQQEAIDVRHDRKARGLHGALNAFADLAEDEADAAAILALRDRLFPQGLKLVQWSYVDEAGDAELVAKRLTKADKALLKNLPGPNGTLEEEHKIQIAAAKELGALEKKKRELSAGTMDTTAADVVRARNAWIRTVTAFVTVLDLEELNDSDRARILGPLKDAERRADRRAPNGDVAEAPSNDEAGAPAGPPGKGDS